MTQQRDTARALAATGLLLAVLGQVFPLVEAGIDQQESLESEAAEHASLRVLVRPVVDVHGLALRAESNHHILDDSMRDEPPTGPAPDGEGAYVQTRYNGGEPRVFWIGYGDLGSTEAALGNVPPDGDETPTSTSWGLLLGGVAVGLALLAGAWRTFSSRPREEAPRFLPWAAAALALGTTAIIGSAWLGFDGHPTGLGLGTGFTALTISLWGAEPLAHRSPGSKSPLLLEGKRGTALLSLLALAAGLASLGPWISTGPGGNVVHGVDGDGIIVLVLMLLAPVLWILRGPGRSSLLAGGLFGGASFLILFNVYSDLQKADHDVGWGLLIGTLLVGAFLTALVLLQARASQDDVDDPRTESEAPDAVTFEVHEADP